MKQKLCYLLFLTFLAATIYSAQGVPYQYFSGNERTINGERIRWFNGDTLGGAVRSNDTLVFLSGGYYPDSVYPDPGVFIISTAPRPNEPPPYWPEHYVFDAPEIAYNDISTWTREQAQGQGRLFENGPQAKALIQFEDHNLRVLWGVQGAPFDSSEIIEYALPDSAIIFFDCPVEISGVVGSVLIFGAAGDIGLRDNVVYVSADTVTGEFAEDETAKLVLVAGGSIVILNTWANGRGNSAQGSNIIIHGMLIALGGDSSRLTFENQNDNWDSYICPCAPDERGQIRLTGSLIQSRRGYVHRSNNGATGYLKQYRFDERFRYWELPVFEIPSIISPDTVNFDTVLVFGEYLDSVQVVLEEPALIDVPRDSVAPFTVIERLYLFDSTFYLPVSFQPPETGEIFDEISLFVEGNRVTIPLHAVVIQPEDADNSLTLSPSSFSLSAYPNPFNPVTTIRLDLPLASRVVLEVFNLAGQKVASLTDQSYSAGTHAIAFDGSSLTSGLYFARLQTGSLTKTTKLLLVK
jgi:hypothetical protein